MVATQHQAVNFIMNKGSVIVVTPDETRIYAAGTPEFDKAKVLILEGDEVGLFDLVNGLKTAIQKAYEGFSVENDVVFIDGEELPNLLGQRLKAFADEGADYKYLLKFWENLKSNPSYRSANLLFNFLERTHCPIDSNGNIQCFKAVTNEFKDKHTHKIDNSPGQVVKMERRLISDDPATPCHVGLHAGSLEYVKGFASGSGDRIVEVLVNPAHVVCVPNDCSYGKMRVEEYTVVKEVPLSVVQPTAQTYGDYGNIEDDDLDDDEDEYGWDDEEWGEDDEEDDLDLDDDDEEDEDF